MPIKQLSIFLENKTGRINEVTKILGKNGINMHAFSMAETTDFGILRLIVNEVEKAVEANKDYSKLSVAELKELCAEKNIDTTGMKKADLVAALEK